MAAVLAVFTLASLITALVLNSQSISFIRNRLSYNMNTYIQSDDAIYVTDRIQAQYQCCGVNLWLDWARVALGATAGPGVSQSECTAENASEICRIASSQWPSSSSGGKSGDTQCPLAGGTTNIVVASD